VSAGPQRNIEGWVQRKRPSSAAAEASKRATETLPQSPPAPPAPETDPTP
jgi:bifunctional UDP-N-acetylglucosamine pyrophosphorylase / glucosamine-1-phosphate N-acetyltransferase